MPACDSAFPSSIKIDVAAGPWAEKCLGDPSRTKRKIRVPVNLDRPDVSLVRVSAVASLNGEIFADKSHLRKMIAYFSPVTHTPLVARS